MQEPPVKVVADRYKLPPELVAGLVELVEGVGWPPLKHLLDQATQQRQLRLEDSKDINEILRAQGGIASLRELQANISNILRDLRQIKEMQEGRDPYVRRS